MVWFPDHRELLSRPRNPNTSYLPNDLKLSCQERSFWLRILAVLENPGTVPTTHRVAAISHKLPFLTSERTREAYDAQIYMQQTRIHIN